MEEPIFHFHDYWDEGYIECRHGVAWHCWWCANYNVIYHVSTYNDNDLGFRLGMKQSQYGVWIFDQLGANLHYELPQKQWVTWLCRCIQTVTAWSPQNPKYHKLSINIYCLYCNPTRPDSVDVLPAGWRHFTMSPEKTDRRKSCKSRWHRTSLCCLQLSRPLPCQGILAVVV